MLSCGARLTLPLPFTLSTDYMEYTDNMQKFDLEGKDYIILVDRKMYKNRSLEGSSGLCKFTKQVKKQTNKPLHLELKLHVLIVTVNCYAKVFGWSSS